MRIRTAVRREIRGLWADGKGVSLAVLSIGFGLLIGARMVLPVLLPHLQSAFDIRLSVAGLLVTVLWLSYSLGQLPAGVLADRYNEHRLMAVSTVAVSASLVLVIVAPTILMLFLAVAVWGLATSIYSIARVTFLSKFYPERLGSALGVTMATSDIGQTVLPPIAALLASSVAWQAGLGSLVPFILLWSIVVFYLIPPVESTASSASSDFSEEATQIIGHLRSSRMLVVSVVWFLYMFIWQSFTAFYPTYLTSVKDLSYLVASVVFGSFFISGVLVKPLSGAAYDRIGVRGALVAILVPPVIGFTILTFYDNVLVIVAATALISTMLGSGAVTQSYIVESLPEEFQGSGLGVVKTAGSSLAAGGPVLFGVVAEYGYLETAYFALAMVLLGAVILAYFIPGGTQA